MIIATTNTITDLLVDATQGLMSFRPFARSNTKYRLICFDDDCAEKLYTAILENMETGDRDFQDLDITLYKRRWLSMVCSSIQDAVLDGNAINITVNEDGADYFARLYQFVEEQAISAVAFMEVNRRECSANNNKEGQRHYSDEYCKAISLWHFVGELAHAYYNEKEEKKLRDNCYPTIEDKRTFPADLYQYDWKHKEDSHDCVSVGIKELRHLCQSLIKTIRVPDGIWSGCPNNEIYCTLKKTNDVEDDKNNYEKLKSAFQSFRGTQIDDEDKDSFFLEALRHNLVSVNIGFSDDGKGHLYLVFNNHPSTSAVASKLALWKIYTMKLDDVLEFIAKHEETRG